MWSIIAVPGSFLWKKQSPIAPGPAECSNSLRKKGCAIGKFSQASFTGPSRSTQLPADRALPGPPFGGIISAEPWIRFPADCGSRGSMRYGPSPEVSDNAAPGRIGWRPLSPTPCAATPSPPSPRRTSRMCQLPILSPYIRKLADLALTHGRSAITYCPTEVESHIGARFRWSGKLESLFGSKFTYPNYPFTDVPKTLPHSRLFRRCSNQASPAAVRQRNSLPVTTSPGRKSVLLYRASLN